MRWRPLLAALLAAPALCAAEESAAPLSGWRAGLDAVGPIRLGMSLEQARRASGLDLQEQPPRGAAWQACHYAWPSQNGGLRLDFGLMIEQGAVTRIDVATPEVPTRSGVRVGDSEDRVGQVYAGRVHAAGAGAARELLAFGDQPHQLVFRLEDGRISAYRVGLRAAVETAEGCA
ncbi:MAG TPA: hypothetical protein VFA75_02980 [Nevskia sp.]|jgi:hypothetical protein|nr:hypothetical protein [Nevskia sp.]